MTQQNCWLGSLHYGNYIDLPFLKEAYSVLLSHNFNIYVDASLMYGSGKSLDVLSALCQEFPSINISIKYGLVSRHTPDGQWGVDIASASDISLYDYINAYLGFIPLSNIHSFQFHAFNGTLLPLWLSQLSQFPGISHYGVSNMNVSQANIVRQAAADYHLDFSFAQLHANILEQKILNEYLHDTTWPVLICNRSLARGFLSDRFISNNLLPDSRILNSPRVLNSLSSNHIDFLSPLHALASRHSFSLSQIAYIFLLFSNKNSKIFPIISPKTIPDLIEFTEIFNLAPTLLHTIISELQDLIDQHYYLLNTYPLHYLEK